MKTEVTIATQNGASSREHNLRNPKVVGKEKHIKKDGYHETWLDVNPREKYKELFGASVKKYNKNQKRPCRRIKNYYGKIEKSAKQKPVYEMIAGVYGKNGNLPREEQKQILTEFIYGDENTPSWEDRNPNFVLCGLYLHGDEESKDLHLHIDYIPVSEGYKTSLEKRTSLNGALEAMGFHHISKKMTMEIQWEKSENGVLERICSAHNLNTLHPDIEGRKHEATEIYKARKEKENLLKMNRVIKAENEKLSTAINDLIGPYISLYMKAIDTLSKMVNQRKKLEAIDKMNATFGFYNVLFEQTMEKVESRELPSEKEQKILKEGILKGENFCKELEEEIEK